MPETVLVTGGAGFIGSHVVRRMLADGHSVRVLDNFSTGSRDNIRGLDDVQLVEGDLLSYERVHNAVRGCTLVMHLGALPSVPRSVADPITSTNVNVMGTLNVLLTARDEGIRRVVYASSSSVYGANAEMPKRESMRPLPVSPYASAKLSGETMCSAFHNSYNVETVSLRFFNVYGPRQNPDSEYAAVIPKFIRAMRQGDPLTVFGDGTQSRDFTFVEDVVDGLVAASMADGVSGEVFNLAGGRRNTLLDLIQELSSILGVEPELQFAPARNGDVPHSQADPTKAEELLSWSAAHTLAEGLRRTVDWHESRC